MKLMAVRRVQIAQSGKSDVPLPPAPPPQPSHILLPRQIAIAGVRVASFDGGLIERGVLAHCEPDPLRPGKLQRLPTITGQTFTHVITYRLQSDEEYFSTLRWKTDQLPIVKGGLLSKLRPRTLGQETRRWVLGAVLER